MVSLGDIKGKNFLVTGGASGLGALYAEEFLKEGAKNVAILDIAEAVGKATAKRLNDTYPGEAFFIKCDVGNEDAISAAFNQVLDKLQPQRLDVIVNNAGIMSDAPDMWRKACDVNWQGLVSLTMKGLKYMRKDEGGSGGTIINVASTAALSKMRYLPIYCGSKMAVLHFSQTLAVEPFHNLTGVRILCICFGPTDTPLLQGLSKRSYDEKTGKACEEEIKMLMDQGFRYQKPVSAVAALMTMFRDGKNGSTWLSRDDKPVEDITPTLEGVFKEFEKLTSIESFSS